MGLIDQIAEKASDKIADHVKSTGGSAVQQEKTGQGPKNVTTPQQTKDPAANAQAAMGLNPSNVSPGTGAQGMETAPAPSTNPAGKAMGLGETDVAPGMNYPQDTQSAPAPVPGVPVPEIEVAKAPAQTYQPFANTPAQSVIGSSKAVDPVKDMSAKPDFWKNVMDVAGKTGKNILELLGDFAAGYSHQTSSPTEQRLAREHDLRMQGNQIQAQKDLMSMSQGFQSQQAALDREFQNKWNATTDERERAALKQQYDMQTRQLQMEQRQMENNYSIAMLNMRWQNAAQQGQTGGAGNFYKFGGE